MSGTGSTIGRATVRAIRGTVFTLAVLVAGVLALTRLESTSRQADRSSDDERPKAAGETSANEAGLSVKLDARGQKKGGIETAPLQAMTYQERARAFGTVLALDRLTTLYNSSLTAAANLESAQAKMSASKTANERAQKLLKVFTTAVAQAEAADAAYKVDAAGVAAAQAQIDALRNTAVQDWGQVLGPAVVSRSDRATQLVLRKTCLVQISFQSETFRKPPEKISLDVGGGTRVEAWYVSEATQIDPKSQTAGFLYAAPATPSLLPGMSLVARVPVGPAGPGFAIPASAIVWQGGRAWFYLRPSPDTFVRQPISKVAVTRDDGGFIVPATSVQQGDAQLVTEGAQALLSEESRSQFPSAGDDQ